MLQTSLLLMKSLNKTETPIFLSVVCSLFPEAIFLTLFYFCRNCTGQDFRVRLISQQYWENIFLIFPHKHTLWVATTCFRGGI